MKSREGLDRQPAFSTALLDWFRTEWYRRYNIFNTSGDVNFENVWRMNIGIARCYKFGLFRGSANNELVRVWPILK